MNLYKLTIKNGDFLHDGDKFDALVMSIIERGYLPTGGKIMVRPYQESDGSTITVDAIINRLGPRVYKDYMRRDGSRITIDTGEVVRNIIAKRGEDSNQLVVVYGKSLVLALLVANEILAQQGKAPITPIINIESANTPPPKDIRLGYMVPGACTGFTPWHPVSEKSFKLLTDWRDAMCKKYGEDSHWLEYR